MHDLRVCSRTVSGKGVFWCSLCVCIINSVPEECVLSKFDCKFVFSCACVCVCVHHDRLSLQNTFSLECVCGVVQKAGLVFQGLDFQGLSTA